MVTVIEIPFIQKIRDVVGQELMDTLVVHPRFGNGDSVSCKIFGQFPREQSRNEPDSYNKLLQHDDYNVTQKEGRE